jgi:hypothetical protein
MGVDQWQFLNHLPVLFIDEVIQHFFLVAIHANHVEWFLSSLPYI